jgi:hypothetical protein
MDFRDRVGDERFADVAFADLQTDPIGTLEPAYERVGLSFPEASRQAVSVWASGHEPGAHGTHTYDLADFGLVAGQVRERFAPYLEAFAAEVEETRSGG